MNLRELLLHSDGSNYPDLTAMLAIHRRADSFVFFMTRDSAESVVLPLDLPSAVASPSRKTGRPKTALPVGRLQERPPELIEALEDDCFFSINGFYTPYSRRTENLTALNAAWVDLDCYTMAWSDVVEAIVAMTEGRVIPPPSIVVRSGRGAWLFWLLCVEEDRHFPPKARSAERNILLQINLAIVTAVKGAYPELWPDIKCTDLARIVRVPGSVNMKAGRRVQFVLNERGRDSRLYYTLHELSGFFSAETVGNVFRPNGGRFARFFLEPRDPAVSRRSGAGLSKVTRQRMVDFERLRKRRGGFRIGHRNNAALVKAVLLRAAQKSDIELEREMAAFGAECMPPLMPREVAAVIRSANSKVYRLTNKKIASWLDVTEEEVQGLSLLQLRPDFEPKRRFSRVPKGRKKHAAERRAVLAQVLTELRDSREQLPSLSDLCATMNARGFSASSATFRADLDAAGVERSHRRGRPKVLKAARQVPEGPGCVETSSAQTLNAAEGDVAARYSDD